MAPKEWLRQEKNIKKFSRIFIKMWKSGILMTCFQNSADGTKLVIYIDSWYNGEILGEAVQYCPEPALGQ